MAQIRVIYKSGATIDLKCESFSIKRNVMGDLVGVTWKDAVPEPLHAGITDIAAVWQLK